MLTEPGPMPGLREASARAGLVLTAVVGVVMAPLAAAAEPAPSSHPSQMHDMMEWGTTAFVLSEVLEYAPGGTDRPIRYDLLGWVGGPVNRIWAKAEGEQSTRSRQGATELQVLYGRLISPFWDAQVGLRLDLGYGDGDGESKRDSRILAALGLQGLAPGWFEIEPSLFISQHGDVSASVTASYDLLLTQRLVAEPRVEVDAAVQDVPEFGVGSGLGGLEVGLRVRYELLREVAPYLGVSWERRLMEAADLARTAGESVQQLSVVAGLRLWY
jgi:copper resistance protein B